MSMIRTSNIVRSALAAFAAVLTVSTAQAQTTRKCQIMAQSTSAVATYDPFNPTAVNLTNVQITFTRLAATGGAKASTLDFYLRSNNSGANGIELTPLSAVGGGAGSGYNQDIFYGTNESAPIITVPLANSPAPGVFRWLFNGANDSSDQFTVNFSIKLPANLNVAAASNLVFDINYGCNGTGGGPQFSETGTAPNAFTLNVTVKSGLQASFVGPSLDFGEVGDKTDAQAAASPIVRSGNLRVASSGPYTVAVSSQNGYRLTYSGGNPATEAQNLKYQLDFLGDTRNETNTATVTKTCVRAGLGSPPLSGGRLLPVQVSLREGGAEEVPSTGYQDILTVTVTPLAGTASASMICGSL
jgi:hypothetical protein